MVKYVVLIVALLVTGRGPVDINGLELNCLGMTTIEAYVEYAGWCPYVWPFNSIYTVLV